MRIGRNSTPLELTTAGRHVLSCVEPCGKLFCFPTANSKRLREWIGSELGWIGEPGNDERGCGGDLNLKPWLITPLRRIRACPT